MQRRRIFAFYLGILAVWMQLVAPVAVAAAASGPDPFAIICSHSAPADHGSRPDRSKDHSCCLLCCAHAAGLEIEDSQPSFTALDYPATSPLGWRLTAAMSTPAPRPRQHPPRGPPTFI